MTELRETQDLLAEKCARIAELEKALREALGHLAPSPERLVTTDRDALVTKAALLLRSL